MKQYEMFELTLPGEPPVAGSSQDLQATFTCGTASTTVGGFYAGEGTYKIRFMPDQVGTYSYEIFGGQQLTGRFECEAAETTTKIHAADQHFEYATGENFTPFGTTVYGLPSQPDALIRQTVNSLKHSPFNKVRFCIFPKYYDFNHDEPPFFPFHGSINHWDIGDPDLRYWRRLDAIIDELGDADIQCDIILFHPYDKWGFSTLSIADAQHYLDYAIRRLAAHPNIWWSFANEYDLMAYTKDDFKNLIDFVHQHDAFNHLTSCHNFGDFWNPKMLGITHASLQIADVTYVSDYIDRYKLPVVVDECRYEGNIAYTWGNLSGFEMVNRFWKVVTQGGYCTHGETFLDPHDILWWAKGGELKGKSPERIGFLKNIIDQIPGPLEYWRTTEVVDKTRLARLRDTNIKEKPLEVLTKTSPEFLSLLLPSLKLYQAHYKDDAFLIYYGENCPGIGHIPLPENTSYSVSLIDVWNETEQVINADATGDTPIALPGKSGIALLALKN